MTLDIFEENLEKYNDPQKYDELYDTYKEDLHYILECVEKVKEPIIELACGTGRLTISMAQSGYKMYAVDIHQGMLDLAIQKAMAANVEISFSLQDCTRLNLPISSTLVFMTGNSFQHFLTNESQDALFQSVKSHLQSKGEFIFDTRNPILSELAIIDESEEHYTNANNQFVTEKHQEVYDHQSQILKCTTTHKVFENDEIVETYTNSISLRYTYPMELERLLTTHGFDLVALYGSWTKLPYTKDSISMIVHCRLK